MNRRRSSAPRPAIHEVRQQELSHLVLPPPHPKIGDYCSASGDNWGGFALVALQWASSLPLAPAHSARCLEGGEKVRAFLPQNHHVGLQNAGIESASGIHK